MTLTLSNPLSMQRRGDGRVIDVASLDLLTHGWSRCPVIMFDDFKVRGHPFGPHPHAGFSAVTYVFEDSPGRLRSRDSLGNDHVVGQGGIVWTQAANGVLHEEMLVDADAELHGLQFFVNLTGSNKTIAPAVFALDGDGVPVVEAADATQVRVVVGTHHGVTSPVRPAEPFALLDITLARELHVEQEDDWIGLVYARHAPVTIETDGDRRVVPAGTVVMVSGGGVLRLSGAGARALYLAGPQVRESVVQHGPFIMRDETEVHAAATRYRRGEMGQLARHRL